MKASSRDENSVGRVGMKTPRQTIRFQGNLVGQLHSGGLELFQSSPQPVLGRDVELQASAPYQTSDLERGDRGHENGLVGLNQRVSRLSAQPLWSHLRPHKHMSIQKNRLQDSICHS